MSGTTPTDAAAALLRMRDLSGCDATVHTIDGYDGENQFCVHPRSLEDEEFRAPTLEEACRKALAHLARIV